MDAPDLTGQKVLLTRPARQAAPWRDALIGAGAVVIEYPTIAVGPPPSWQPLDAAFARLHEYDWLLFTSANAVEQACARLPAGFVAHEARPQVAAVGDETARALVRLGFTVALVPADHRQEGLVAAMEGLPRGSRILFPQAIGGRDHLPVALRARGLEVDVVPASQTVAVPLPGPPPPFDVALFASPSALAAFAAQLGQAGLDRLAAARLVAIGATTAAAARAHGLSPILAPAPSISAVIETLSKTR